MLKLRPYTQLGVSAHQQYMHRLKHGLTRYTQMPNSTQFWMCPRCDRIHYKEKHHLVQYNCDVCDWEGNRQQLLTTIIKGDNHA